jgi:signal transduction histidine kinase/ActR/RegA family two-component response regulator
MTAERRVVSARELLAQRNVLITLATALGQDAPGGVMSVGIEVIRQGLKLRGALAYRSESGHLTLVAEADMPRKAQAWLKHLPLGDEHPWFVAQRVAQRLRSEVDTNLAEERAGVSIAGMLREEGWSALLGVPVALGRQLKGVLVLAAGNESELDREKVRVLEAAGMLLALALEREEQRERQSERLEEAATVQLATVGLVASSVAEDLDGPLHALQLQLDYHEELVRRLRSESVDQHLLDELSELAFEMAAGIRRVSDLTMRLAGSQASAESTLDLSRVIRTAVAMMHPHADARGVRLELEGADDELAVDGREAELRMLVVQLLLYAVRHCADVEEPRVIVSLHDEEGRCSLSLETTGRGASDKRSGIEIFEALLSRGGGSEIDRIGLGLAKQTVLAHHGHIEVGRSPLGGMKIRALLPLSALSIQPPEDRQSVPTPTLRPEGDERIVLWIDGDELWTAGARRFLEGYEVRTASSSVEARLRLAELTVVPEAIFCSIQLPDGSGLDLHRVAPASLAERFVFVSEGVLPLESAAYLRESGCPTLIKPLTIDEVMAVLEQRQSYPDGRSSGVPTLRPSSPSRPPGRSSDPPYD